LFNLSWRSLEGVFSVLNSGEIIAMHQLGWFPVAWVGGSLAILGSFMTLGSLLLWLVPQQSKDLRINGERSPSGTNWQNHVKLIAVSVGLAIAGFGLLVVFPLPLG
jgi:hypothetical protein